MNRLSRSLPWSALLSLGISLCAQSAPSAPTKASAPEATTAYEQAYAEMQKKAYGSALPLYEKALALAPERAEVWNEYAICLRSLRRLPAAVQAGWRAIQLDGGRTMQPWNAQANTLMEAHEWEAARTCLEKVETLHQDRLFVARAWLNLAFRKLAAGESAGVVELCRRAAQLEPGNSLAWIDLGQAQACTGGDPKEAVANLEKGRALAEQQKDTQRAEYAGQLLTKWRTGESIWPQLVGLRSWQTIPTGLLSMPDGQADKVPLPALVEHHYGLAENGHLSLTLPESWTEEFDKERPEHLFTARFTEPGRAGFKVFFSLIKGAGNPLGVQDTAKEVAKRLLPGSAEKELTPQELKSSTMKGYWILSTDKRTVGSESHVGDYRHLVSVPMDVDGLQCVGTVLTNSKASDVIDPCLMAFSSARKVGVRKN